MQLLFYFRYQHICEYAHDNKHSKNKPKNAEKIRKHSKGVKLFRLHLKFNFYYNFVNFNLSIHIYILVSMYKVFV